MRWLLAVVVLAACGGNPAGANGDDDDDGATGSADGGTNPGGDLDAGDTGGGSGSGAGSAGTQPEVFAHDCGFMDEMTADATYLYWACNPGTKIHRMPLAGGPIEELYSGPGYAQSIVVDGGFIYIAQTRGSAFDYNDLIVRVPVAGGAPTTIVSPIGVRALDIDDGWIYYSDTPDYQPRILRVPIDGGTSRFLVRARAGTQPFELAVDAGVIYFVDGAGIASVDIQTKRLTDVANVGIATSLTVDAADIYFAACTTGECTSASVYRVPRSGGTPVVVSSGHPGQSKLAKIDNLLQWGSYVIPTGGGPEQTLLASPSQFVVAATPQAFFFGETTTGTIYRVAR